MNGGGENPDIVQANVTQVLGNNEPQTQSKIPTFWCMNTCKFEQHKTFDPGGNTLINRTDNCYDEQKRTDIKDCQFLPNIFSLKIVRAELPQLLKILFSNF